MSESDDAEAQSWYPKTPSLHGDSAKPSSPAQSEEAALRAMYSNSPKMFSSDAAKAPGQQSGDQTAPNPGATQTTQPTGAQVELKLPEGFQADEVTLGDFKSAAKEFGLKSEQAQKLFDLHHRAMSAQTAAYDAQSGSWEAATKSDGEIGGAALTESVGLASGLVKEFGSDALRQVLESGLGNHPELVRLLARAGRALRDARRGSR